MNKGIVEACTGVIWVKPIVEMASRIHSERGGVKASHALEEGFGLSFEVDSTGTILSSGVSPSLFVRVLGVIEALISDVGGRRNLKLFFRQNDGGQEAVRRHWPGRTGPNQDNFVACKVKPVRQPLLFRSISLILFTQNLERDSDLEGYLNEVSAILDTLLNPPCAISILPPALTPPGSAPLPTFLSTATIPLDSSNISPLLFVLFDFNPLDWLRRPFNGLACYPIIPPLRSRRFCFVEMSQQYQYSIPGTPRVISPSPTPSEQSDPREGYFAPVTRSATAHQRATSPPAIPEEKDLDNESSDSSLDKRARTRSRSPVLASTGKRRRMSGLTTLKSTSKPVLKSEPLPIANGTPLPVSNGYLAPPKVSSWRDFSRSPSPLGLIPLHRHYRNLIHRHEIPRKVLHVSIGFLTLSFYTHGIQTSAITPWLLSALLPIAATDYLRHTYPTINKFYIRCLGALMRETEVDGYNGVIWYLLGAYISLKFFPKDIGVMSVLLLSWCDTAASIFGRLYGRYTIRLRRGKSLAGSLAAWAVGALTAAAFWGWLVPKTGAFPNDPEGAFMFHNVLSLPANIKGYLGWTDSQGTVTGSLALGIMSVVSGFVAAASEVVDLWGWDDNVTIPVLTSIGLWGFLKIFG
jgi:diacylglycerol kinase (CTP)